MVLAEGVALGYDGCSLSGAFQAPFRLPSWTGPFATICYEDLGQSVAMSKFRRLQFCRICFRRSGTLPYSGRLRMKPTLAPLFSHSLRVRESSHQK